MIPISDQTPVRRFPIVNYLLILVNFFVFLVFLSAGSNQDALVQKYALVPAQFLANPTAHIVDIFTSMFMHGGWAHILGNMLYLWIFGDNVEDRMGHFPYIFFYLLGGVVASLAHVYTNPASQIPTVGASGAIAAVLGAYLVLFPRGRVLTFIPLGFFLFLRTIPASIVLGFWFILQLFSGLLTLGGPDVGGVAVWAHIGGFVFGLLVALVFVRRTPARSPAAW